LNPLGTESSQISQKSVHVGETPRGDARPFSHQYEAHSHICSRVEVVEPISKEDELAQVES